MDIENKLNLIKIEGASTEVLPPHTGSPKFKFFNLLSSAHEIFRVSTYKGKINLTKFEDTKMGVPPETGPPKLKLFNHSRQTHEIFRVDKYEEKIKYDKIWGYQNEGFLFKWGHQNSNFLTAHARHMKFSK